MSVLKKLRPGKSELVEEDWILPDTPSSPAHTAPDPALPVSSDPPLTADRAAAVRFQIAKPGYEFAQVEAFVQQTRTALQALEQGLYQRDVSLHDAQTDIQDLTEKVATLQATIEVFRANGDPEVAADGSYITEEQWSALETDRDALKRDVERLHSENLTLQTELQEARQSLAAAIPAAEPAVCEHGDALAEAEDLRGEVEALRAELDAAHQRSSQLVSDLTAAQTALDAAPPAGATAEASSEELAAVRQELAHITAERDDALQEIQELRDYIDGALTQWMNSAAQTDTPQANTPEQQPQADPIPTIEGVRQRAPLHDAPELA